jgi:catechol 2,3-dioxygenase-like lactoylglutathione lyase family enzyme
VGEPPPAGTDTDHPIGASRIDHVVVMTPDIDRTVKAVERSLGLPLRRTRDGEAYGQPMRQAFFRMGEVILEVVGPPELDPGHVDRPAGFSGLAVVVASLDAACHLLGSELVSAPKPAVQEGRSIATIRSAAGLQVPVALMSA